MRAVMGIAMHHGSSNIDDANFGHDSGLAGDEGEGMGDYRSHEGDHFASLAGLGVMRRPERRCRVCLHVVRGLSARGEVVDEGHGLAWCFLYHVSPKGPRPRFRSRQRAPLIETKR